MDWVSKSPLSLLKSSPGRQRWIKPVCGGRAHSESEKAALPVPGRHVVLKTRSNRRKVPPGVDGGDADPLIPNFSTCLDDDDEAADQWESDEWDAGEWDVDGGGSAAYEWGDARGGVEFVCFFGGAVGVGGDWGGGFVVGGGWMFLLFEGSDVLLLQRCEFVWERLDGFDIQPTAVLRGASS
ncbi:hypothetical protein V501_06692 [Pseudogymnoascus sp. VKM F-4519 (FW-2642)]|nr:hypothetical protein V501_06692 [Pseudogymnoascus sp. VKM F-4519 (FW-2642)]